MRRIDRARGFLILCWFAVLGAGGGCGGDRGEPVMPAADGPAHPAVDAASDVGLEGGTNPGADAGAPAVLEPPFPGERRFTTVERDPPPAAGSGEAPAPPGKLTSVEEADIYRLNGTHLYYFSTYRGFLVFDISDPKQPIQLARLPIHGYPVEMFVDSDVVYAFVRDALHVTHTEGTLQFERRFVSQLHAIDISDPAQPRLLESLDIEGQLYEGVTRRAGNSIYAVSFRSPWNPELGGEAGAWVSSFDVSERGHPRLASRRSIVEPSADPLDPRRLSELQVSATPAALIVAESYLDISREEPDGSFTWMPTRAVISVFDISDPGGEIVRRTRLETFGMIVDQFKMSVRIDASSGKATFFALLLREDHARGAAGNTQRATRLETWDFTDGAHPVQLASLPIGDYAGYDTWRSRPSAFDLDRNLLYAMGVGKEDPLVSIDLADPAAPKVQAPLGDFARAMDLFRPIAGGEFLLGVGDHPAGDCTGEAPSYPDRPGTQVALTLVDTRDPGGPRVAQRLCVKLPGDAGGTGLRSSWNLDQAHKLLGTFAEGSLNVLTVPLWFARRQEIADPSVGWYYQWQTAVGLASWDLSRLDDTLPAGAQTVLQGHGTVIHPEGEVKRAIGFRHPTTGARSLIALSDSHLALSSIDDLAQPRLESSVEIAPSVYEIQRFGAFIVERVDIGGRWSPDGAAEFRVKSAGGPVDSKQPVATFRVGQAREVYRYKDHLLVLRTTATAARPTAPTEAVLYDLSDPTRPRLASRLILPFSSTFYYGFFCGTGDWGYWPGQLRDSVITDVGLVRRYIAPGDGTPENPATARLAVLDLRNPAAPAVFETVVPAMPVWSVRGLVADSASPSAFYLIHRDTLDRVGSSHGRYRYFAQRWEIQGSTLVASDDVNLPGQLARTWVDPAGQRMFLAADITYRGIGSPDRSQRHEDARLHLLRQEGAGAGSDAVLVDSHTMPDLEIRSLVSDGTRLFLDIAPVDALLTTALMPATPWQETSDRLVTFDLTSGNLTPLHDHPLRAMDTQLMGVHDNHLFIHLDRDGVLVANVADLAHPRGARYLRTFGWPSHVQFTGTDAYVASGPFGVLHFDLATPAAAQR
jgi:hypothetical protein